MRTSVAVLLLASIVSCGPSKGRDVDAGTGEIDAPPDEPCTGLECRIPDCPAGTTTSLSGTAFAPNGTLALYGVTVYVPNLDPGTFTPGVACDRCDSTPLPGEPIAVTTSDEAGHFKLDGVPAGSDIPVILTVGKWRRKALLPAVVPCTENVLPAMYTSLPKNKSQGELPKIAIATGGCDGLECLVRKLGVSNSEFTTDAGDGSVHLYTGSGGGISQLADGTPLTAATVLWGDLEKLKKYDVTLFGCECGPVPAQKPQTAMATLKAYADLGGRVFLSHYHNIWVSGGRGTGADDRDGGWPGIATCDTDSTVSGNATIDQVDNPKGMSFATWMVNVQGSTTLGQVPVTEGKRTCTAIDDAKVDRWVYHQATGSPQNFQFTTPQEVVAEERCGKVVFSDMHVSGSSSGAAFPTGCDDSPLSPQEKALAFMFFDIAACIGIIN